MEVVFQRQTLIQPSLTLVSLFLGLTGRRERQDANCATFFRLGIPSGSKEELLQLLVCGRRKTLITPLRLSSAEVVECKSSVSFKHCEQGTKNLGLAIFHDGTNDEGGMSHGQRCASHVAMPIKGDRLRLWIYSRERWILFCRGALKMLSIL